jgi:PAS domain S-box-containing protein
MDQVQPSRLLDAQQQVIENIALGASLKACLTCICENIEDIIGAGGAKSSILLLEGDTLRHGAAPRLPKAYCEAIDGVTIGPAVGSCGTAAFTREQVIVTDIETHPYWADFKAIALEHDLRACWSTPLLSSRQEVLGSFAIYYSEIKVPDELHLDLIARFAHLSSFAIEKELNERVLRDSQEYQRKLFDASPIGLALCRLNGELVDVNPAYARIIGRTVEDTLTKTYWEITPDKYAEDEQRQLESLETTGKYGPYEKEYIHIDGSLVPVRLNGMHLDRGGQRYIWSSVEDIAQQKRDENVLRHAQNMEVVGQMAGGVAHDFNNILCAILGNTDLLKLAIGDNPGALPFVDEISVSAQRAADLTKQLLGFSRRRSPQNARSNINELMEKMGGLIARSLTPEVVLIWRLEDRLWETDIEVGDFENAVFNLVLNARDAMPQGGRLTLATHNRTLDEAFCVDHPSVSPGEYVELAVTDTGEGMPDELLEQIFEPFFTTKAQGKGTGLGLATVFGFVERSGGCIHVQSQQGAGSVFKIYLPKSKGLVPSAHPPEGAEASLGGEETILVVDDEEALLTVVRNFLQALGYGVLIASSGKTALELLAENPGTALLFSDVVMPGMNGYELAKTATAEYPNLKVVLTSGNTGKATSPGDEDRPAPKMLEKPYRLAELAPYLRSILDAGPEETPGDNP